MSQKTVLITAGGTGGHVFPALSVAKKLQHEYDILWVGAKSGIENDIVPKNNLPLITVNISGLRKKGLVKMLLMPFILLYALFQCAKILLQYRPDVIVGFGGYATFPICFMAWVLRIPVVIHEQNSVPGLSNKVLSKIANYVMVAFNGVLKSKKSYVVGNPVRKDITQLDPPEIRYNARHNGLNLLVLGGSLGAKALNDTLPEVCSRLSNLGKVLHQVGRGDAEAVSKHYASFGVNAQVVNFIDDMAKSYSEADLIICRSGASTVSEVCVAGIAAVFVPYPFAVDDHQRYNAEPLVAQGAAYLLLQSDLTIEKLTSLVNSLDRDKCLFMANKARTIAIDDSVSRIVDIIKKCIV